jgi:hypothetical protein
LEPINLGRKNALLESRVFREIEACAVTMRAISKFAAVYDGVTPSMKAHYDWIEKRGILAKEPEEKSS